MEILGRGFLNLVRQNDQVSPNKGERETYHRFYGGTYQ